MRFWLGTHMVNWIETEVDLFISRRRLQKRKTMPVAVGPWALDSGGFTELSEHGRWLITEQEYVVFVQRYIDEIGSLEWAAPMDWMCEPFVLAKTGKTVDEHQDLTVSNFLYLREHLGLMVIPVLQGYEQDEYLICVEKYERAGVDLSSEPLVGVGSVCRRQDTQEAARIFRSLDGLRLHGFGVKKSGLVVYADSLVSADSMSWSTRARRSHPLKGCTHKSCANCLIFARRWRGQIDDILNRTRLEFA